MKVMFGDQNISDINHEFLEKNQFDNMINAVESMNIIDYYGVEKLLYLEDKYGLETEELVNIIGFTLGVESLNIPINMYNHEIINELVGGLEGIPADLIKTGWRATKGTVKAVHKLHKTVYKNAKQLSSKWNTNIKPLIIKFLKEFQAQLQIMWGKFRKYDKLYTKLGKEINSVTQVYGKQMNSMRSVSLFYHKFNPNALKGYAEAIKDYDAFMGSLTGSTELFGGKFVPPKEFANYLRSKNIAKAKECVDSMSEGMSKLNSRGDLAFAYAIINDNDKNVSKSNFRKIRECFTGPEPEQILKTAIKNKSPLVEFVQVSILRKEIEGKYEEKDIGKFRNDMLGNAGFLTIMSSILNNKVIEKVLTGGGKTIKDQTKEDMAAMEEIVRSGMSEQQNNPDSMSNKVAAEKDEKARQSAEVTGNNGKQSSATLEQEVQNAQSNTKTMKDGNLSEEFNPFGYDMGAEGFFDFFKPKKKEVKPKMDINEIHEIIKDFRSPKLHNAIKSAFKSEVINKHAKFFKEQKNVYIFEITEEDGMAGIYYDLWNLKDPKTGKENIARLVYKVGEYDELGDEMTSVGKDIISMLNNVLQKVYPNKYPNIKADYTGDWDDGYICYVLPDDVCDYIFNNGGTEGLVETVTNYFRKTSAIQKAEAKKNSQVTSLTLTEYKKAIEKFFLEHKKILEDMLKPYSSTVKKYHVEINVPKYIEYDEIEDDAGGKLYIDFSKALNYADDYNDSDGEEVARIIGIHPDGSDKFGAIIKKAFKNKFGFDLELDGDTDLVAFYTPDLKSITFEASNGTEGLFDLFNTGNESENNYFVNFFDQSIFSEGTEAGLTEAMGYDADNKQKAEAKAASTDKISTDPNDGEMGIAELADAYIQSYSILMSKATAAYSSMVKGFLAATFTLCKEADTIVKEIYAATGANRSSTNEAVSQDRPNEEEIEE